mmetsp:Transcript_3452/g.7598  ORF Transcript_3452/g.7598 Transcript_3452/m.7598 type:complete len:122 (-) Transcript_3452:137-502(-)
MCRGRGFQKDDRLLDRSAASWLAPRSTAAARDGTRQLDSDRDWGRHPGPDDQARRFLPFETRAQGQDEGLKLQLMSEPCRCRHIWRGNSIDCLSAVKICLDRASVWRSGVMKLERGDTITC